MAKSQVPGQGSQGLRPERDVWTREPNLEGSPTSLGFHLLSAEIVSSLSAWILMTRSQFSLPLRIRFLEANQRPLLASGSLPTSPT